ncbi:MAG: hypothetical protein WDW38_006503 [Sanguina aurantia]
MREGLSDRPRSRALGGGERMAHRRQFMQCIAHGRIARHAAAARSLDPRVARGRRVHRADRAVRARSLSSVAGARVARSMRRSGCRGRRARIAIDRASSRSQHHHHGAYILRHADLAGFSRQEQQLLAAVVEMHRRKPDKALIASLPLRYRALGFCRPCCGWALFRQPTARTSPPMIRQRRSRRARDRAGAPSTGAPLAIGSNCASSSRHRTIGISAEALPTIFALLQLMLASAMRRRWCGGAPHASAWRWYANWSRRMAAA